MINKARAWEEKILRLTFRPRTKPDETWVGYRTRTAKKTKKLEEDGSTASDRNIANKIWTTVTWDMHESDVPITLALRAISGWRTTAWWRSGASQGMAWDPYNAHG